MTIDQAIKKAIKRWGQGSSIHIFLDHDRGLLNKWCVIKNITIYDPFETEVGFSNESLEDAFKDAARRELEGVERG